MRARAIARLRRSELDAVLAAGVSPDSSAALSLRAHTLIGAPTRTCWRGGSARSSAPPTVPSPPWKPAFRCAARLCVAPGRSFDELACLLDSSAPVDAGGVARLRLLLIDGSSPFYRRAVAADLTDALLATTEALEPDPWV